MGGEVRLAAAAEGHDVVGVIGPDGDRNSRGIAEAVAALAPDAAIEFTTPQSGEDNVTALVQARLPTVSGTTGWDPATVCSLADRLRTPLMVAPNFSVGAVVLAQLVRRAADMLRAFSDYQPAIIERHHKLKRDAPSGTARMLADQIRAGGRGSDVPIGSVRQGGQPGEHTIYFEGSDECLTLSHQVRSRRTFALGAVRAACWLATEQPGRSVTFESFLERMRQ